MPPPCGRKSWAMNLELDFEYPQALCKGENLMSQKSVILFKSETVLVRLMTLDPHEIGQKHYHSHIADTQVCVEGRMALCVDDEQPVELLPGQQASVSSPHPHYVQNLGAEIARYILLQTGGAYDFLPVA
jgi:quercetin dioxygenase-like cupin family protein